VRLYKSIFVALLTKLYTCRFSYYICGVEKGIMLVVPPYLKILDQPSIFNPARKKTTNKRRESKFVAKIVHLMYFLRAYTKKLG
jgi:hypothetical protein